MRTTMDISSGSATDTATTLTVDQPTHAPGEVFHPGALSELDAQPRAAEADTGEPAVSQSPQPTTSKVVAHDPATHPYKKRPLAGLTLLILLLLAIFAGAAVTAIYLFKS